ncbi:hypothetical protein [Eudoraea adriatica]|uniref:hypothetical protein n=1 Tax=Eudoraea adriatica TaxID=446681 RepID=UPI0012FB1E8A|nr:hypothetical protein [Eudoraea adriatica]
MKKLFSFMAIVAIVLVSNCSRIPENNDPVIGIWYKVDVINSGETNKQTIRQEWIFNDAYLGRYQKYNGSVLDFKTDFSWVADNEIYTISYPGTEMIKDVVSMKESPEGMLLENVKGEILAKRE